MYLFLLQIYNTIEADLNSFGVRVATDIYDLHLDCEQNPPRLQTYNAWGRRVDNLLTCSSWKQLKRESAQEGLVAIGYEREFGQWRYGHLSHLSEHLISGSHLSLIKVTKDAL